jgi:hypothetical protein
MKRLFPVVHPPSRFMTQRKSFRALNAFSLVEVVLAIGIVAFAFVALLALMPMGLTNFRKAMNASVGSEIGQRVFNDLQQTDFDTLLKQANLTPAPESSYDPQASPSRVGSGSLPHRYFDDDGNEVVIPGLATGSDPTSAQRNANHILYDVHSQVILTPQIPSSPGGGSGGMIFSANLANIIVQIVSNPAGATLKEVQVYNPTSSNDSINNPSFMQFSGFVSRNGRTNTASTGS